MTTFNHSLGRTALAGFIALLWSAICIAMFIGFDGDFEPVAAGVLALYLYTTYKLWNTVMDDAVRPLAMMFWLFHTNFLLLPALSQSLNRTFFWSAYDSYSQESLLFALLVIVIGLLAYNAGGWFGAKAIRRSRRWTRPGAYNFFTEPLKATWKVQLFLVAILALLTVMIAKTGLEFFMTIRMERSGLVDTQSEAGILVNLPRALAVGVLLFPLFYLMQKWRQQKRLHFAMLLILCAGLCLNTVINYPLGLARFWFFGIIITLVWAVKPMNTVKMRGLFVVGLTALQFSIFPWYSYITRASGLLGYDVDSMRRYLTHGDFDGFQSIANILIYVQEAGYELGRSMLSVILFFVPRTLWSSKADPLGVATAEHVGYDFTNLSAPIYGELYVDFGFFSLILGMALIGFGIRLFDNYYHTLVWQGRYGAGMLLTSVLAGYLVILLRGSLLGVISGIATLFGMLVIASWLAIPGSHNRLKIFQPRHL